MTTDSSMQRTTALIHPETRETTRWESLCLPTERASTVVFPDLKTFRSSGNWEDDTQWRYGINGTPTTAALAQRIAILEGGEYALLQPSGLSAISNIYFGLVRQGDDVLVPDNAYVSNREHGDWLAERLGISVRYYDPLIGAGIEGLIQANTRLLWIEAPGSVTMEVPDVPALTLAARKHGVITAIDNTYSGGLAFQPFMHGCDISMHALTKYPSGGSDVLMGATVTKDRALYNQLKVARMRMGLNVSADDCSLVLRSLTSLAARFEAHSRSALEIAQWLKNCPEIALVLHPALTDCPGHAHWKRDSQGGAGGLFSVVFDATITQTQIDAFIEGLHLFKIGLSWGGAHSLALPYTVSNLRTTTRWPHAGILVRFYIGLENTQDLLVDLKHSLRTHLGFRQQDTQADTQTNPQTNTAPKIQA